MHVLPNGFVRIRYFGFFGNRHRRRNIPAAPALSSALVSLSVFRERMKPSTSVTSVLCRAVATLAPTPKPPRSTGRHLGCSLFFPQHDRPPYQSRGLLQSPCRSAGRSVASAFNPRSLRRTRLSWSPAHRPSLLCPYCGRRLRPTRALSDKPPDSLPGASGALSSVSRAAAAGCNSLR